MGLLQRVLPVNRVLLASQWAGLAQARMASQFGPPGDAGIPLFLGQGVAVIPGGGTEPGPGTQLRGCPRVAGTEVKPANLFAVAHEPDPIAAPAALEGDVKTLSGGRAERAAAADALGSDRSSHIRHYAASA